MIEHEKQQQMIEIMIKLRIKNINEIESLIKDKEKEQ